MKKIASLILFTALFRAIAQHTIEPLLTGGTNNVPALATNVAPVGNVTRGQYIALQVRFAAGSGSTSNLVVRVDSSVDSEAWQDSTWVFPVAATGTTMNTFVTNLVGGATGYIRVNACNTNASGAFTNLSVTVAGKPGI